MLDLKHCTSLLANSSGCCSAEGLQSKAKVLAKKQRQLQKELQQLQAEAENLPKNEQKQIQAQLHSQVVKVCRSPSLTR